MGSPRLEEARGAGQRIDSARLNEAQRFSWTAAVEEGAGTTATGTCSGKELRPYVPTTAVALLALQKTEQPAAASSRRVWHISIARLRPSRQLSPFRSRSWRFGRHAHAVQKPSVRCLPTNSDRAIDLGHQLGVAMALYALQAEKADAFAL